MFEQLDEVPIFKATEERRQLMMDFVYSITKENYKEKIANSDFLIPQNIYDQYDLLLLFRVALFDYRNAYYKVCVLHEILKKSTIRRVNILEDFNAFFELYAFLYLVGYFTKSEMLGVTGANKIMEALIVFINSTDPGIILGLIKGKSSGNNLVRNANHMNYRMEIFIELFEFSSHSDITDDAYIDFIIKHAEEINQIIRCDCKTTNILTAIINDDLEYFVEHQEEKNDCFRENKLYNKFYFTDLSDIVLASIYRSHRIIKYILENDPITIKTHKAALYSAFYGDFEAIRLFDQKIKFFPEVFVYSLLQTNIELVQFLFDRTKITFINKRFTLLIPPSSYMFLMKHSLLFMFDNIITDIHGYYRVLGGELDIFNIRGNTPPEIVKYAFSHYQFSVSNIRRMINLPVIFTEFINAIGTTVTKEDAIKIVSHEIEIMSINQQAFVSFINKIGKDLLNARHRKYERLAFFLARMGKINVVNAILDCEGFDINNSEHPDESALIHYAILNKDTPVIMAVLGKEGIDINRLDRYKRSAVDICTNPAITNILITNGCRPAKTRAAINDDYLIHIRMTKPQSIICSSFTAVKLINGSYSANKFGSKSKPKEEGPFKFGCSFKFRERDEFFMYDMHGLYKDEKMLNVGGRVIASKPKGKKN